MTITHPVHVLHGRAVPLGGLRSLEVRRTLPHRDRAMVGAWCFVDHYGPEAVLDATRDGMNVPPHPHTGLQTVSWLFAGAIEHRDSGGAHVVVRPGEMNLMTSGVGITHSEVSTPDTSTLHGVQLWIALPEAARHGSRAFAHHVPDEVRLAHGSAAARVFLGELAGVDASPVLTHTPLVGTELRLDAHASVTLDVDADFEHAVLVDSGEVTLAPASTPPSPDGHSPAADSPVAHSPGDHSPAGTSLLRGDLGVVDPGSLTLTLTAGDAPARLVLIGGEPFGEEIVMWWNFVGRSHDEIADAREQYEAGSNRFGHVEGYEGAVSRIPAPPLPPVHLRPRGRRH